MKIDFLPSGKKAFKANLHTHSNLSDGNMTPEQLRDVYHDHGYSVLAITDHEFCLDHSDLNLEDFLLITGYELQVVDPVRPRRPGQKCCHMCLLSKDPHEFRHVFFNPDAYDLRRLCHVPELIPEMKYAGEPFVEKYYDVDLINEIAVLAKENNFLIAYNHPQWSLEEYPTYAKLRGFYAMEIYNNDCYTIGIDEYNPAVYDCMLRHGARLGCIATDDSHQGHPLGDPKCDLFGGWTMIYAESLDYDKIMAALEKGDFYASTGPEIKAIWVEDGSLHVETDDVHTIALSTAGRRSAREIAPAGGSLREAVFPLREDDGYVRITVKDHQGRPANSRAYFTDEYMK